MELDANAWITLAEAKAHLHISISDSDCNEFISQLINYGYKFLEGYIGRQAKSKEYTESYDGDDSNVLVLKKWPVISVASVHIDQDGERIFDSEALVDSDDYYVDTDPDTSIGQIELFQATGTGPTWFSKGIKNIQVVYTAGWATVPYPLKFALQQLVAWHFRRSGTEATRQQSIGGFSKSYEDDNLPPHIKRFLDPYKNLYY